MSRDGTIEKRMTNRRELLRIGLAAATVLPLGASATVRAVGSAGQQPHVPLYKVVYDTRFAASVAFANRVTAHGIAVEAMAGDMTRFWYDDLYHRWRQGPAAIAGLTAHGALFCLEQLAWAERMRVVFRARHLPPANGCVRHELEGPAPLIGAVQRAVAGSDWATAMADAVMQCPPARLTKVSTWALTLAPVIVTPAAEPLFSWVIAPVPRG
jgi:hypothetical protein